MNYKISKEQQELFDNNFDKSAYKRARQSVQDAISKSKTFEELWSALSSYERDSNFNDDFSIIYCEVELDRSNIQTPADYVGMDFAICWDDNTNQGWIDKVSLHSSDTPNRDVKLICFIHPNTCEVIEWCYE